jgi:AcrR family transcriptional regulator
MAKRNMATEKPKRTQILNAAEKTMALKGFNDSTIAETAEEAGVVDSVICQLFKGKEDFLFSKPKEKIKENKTGYCLFERAS